MKDSLAKAITSARSPVGARIRVGVISSTSPLQVSLDGATVDVNRITTYSPTISDVVSILVDGNHYLVLGVSA